MLASSKVRLTKEGKGQACLTVPALPCIQIPRLELGQLETGWAVSRYQHARPKVAPLFISSFCASKKGPYKGSIKKIPAPVSGSLTTSLCSPSRVWNKNI